MVFPDPARYIIHRDEDQDGTVRACLLTQVVLASQTEPSSLVAS
jgi:hypothetical protein